MRLFRRWIRRFVWFAAAVSLLVLLLGSFALTPADRARLEAFTRAVDRWQINPDFREVQRQYVKLGVSAMQARLYGIRAEKVVMAFRSLPGLPRYLALSPTSASHYRDFSEGEFSAYLHLAGEQGIADGVAMLENLVKNGEPTDDEIRAFLGSFKLPYSISTDAGAVASVRAVLSDTNPRRPFTVRGPIPALVPRTSDLRQLDDQLRVADPELWRTKQVSDFLAGIWAQGYGRIYQTGIIWLLRIQRISQVLLVLLIAGIILFYLRHRSRAFARRAGGDTIASCPDPNPPPGR